MSGKRRNKYGILLDMVSLGALSLRNTTLSVCTTGRKKVWKLVQNIRLRQLLSSMIRRRHRRRSLNFVNTIAKIPMIDIINRQPGARLALANTGIPIMTIWTSSTPLRAVGQVLLAVVYRGRQIRGDFSTADRSAGSNMGDPETLRKLLIFQISGQLHL